MGDANRRKKLGTLPAKTTKPRKKSRTKVKSDFIDDMMGEALAAMSVVNLMSSRHRLPSFITKFNEMN